MKWKSCVRKREYELIAENIAAIPGNISTLVICAMASAAYVLLWWSVITNVRTTVLAGSIVATILVFLLSMPHIWITFIVIMFPVALAAGAVTASILTLIGDIWRKYRS